MENTLKQTHSKSHITSQQQHQKQAHKSMTLNTHAEPEGHKNNINTHVFNCGKKCVLHKLQHEQIMTSATRT